VLVKRLLYFNPHEVTAYRWDKGALRREAVFATSEQGVADFSRYVTSNPDSLVTTSGTRATRRSPGTVSESTPIFTCSA